MIRWLKHRVRQRRDDGAILVFAIIIVTTVALVVGTLLTRGDGSLRATVALRSVAGTSYAADGAANVAINDLRQGYGFASTDPESGFNNSLDGKGCFGNAVGNGGTDSLSLNGFYPATGSVGASSAYVECAGEAGTGQQGSPVPINNSNKPGYAIITLNGDITALQTLNVHGGVYSNNNIVGPVALDAGDAWAKGTCASTTVSGTATKHCNSGQTIADPNYSNELGGSVPALQSVPTTCSSGVAIFKPGYYDDAQALTNATNMCSVAWFKPGNYYFDFHNDGCADVCPTNLFGANNGRSNKVVSSVPSNVWSIGNDSTSAPTVIGGTPINAAGTVLSQPSSSATVPGSCQSPITDVNAQGVHFVFGGNSQMYVSSNSNVELCGTYHADRPPLVIYGLKSGSTPSPTTDTARDVSNGGSVSGVSNFTGATVANLKSGGSGATWTTANASKATASLTVSGFNPSVTVPAGAVLTGATLHITHKDGDTANAAPTANLKVGSTTVSIPTASLPTSATSTTANIVMNKNSTNALLTAFNNLQTEVHTNGYSGASVSYSVSARANNVTSTAGPITLDLTYYLPVLRSEASTCITGAGGSCQLISMRNTGNNKILFYLQGTTYTPLADDSFVLSNFSAEVAKFGIIARQLEFNVNTGNPDWKGPVFEIPDNSPGYGYNNSTVDLEVHVCLGEATVSAACKANTPALTSRVQLWDPTGTPVPGSRQITVLSWSRSS